MKGKSYLGDPQRVQESMKLYYSSGEGRKTEIGKVCEEFFNYESFIICRYYMRKIQWNK